MLRNRIDFPERLIPTANRLTCSLRPSAAKNSIFDITYQDKYGGSTASATITYASTTATLTTDATSYDEAATSISLTFTEPDANDSSASKQQLLFNSTRQGNPQTSDGSCSGIYVGSTCNDKKLANFTITSINGTTGYHDIRNHSALILESGVNTGIWTTAITLSSLKTNKDGRGGHPLGLAAGD